MRKRSFPASKYGVRLDAVGKAERMSADGNRFDSKAERKRYETLLLMQKAGLISDLKIHPRWPVVVEGRPARIFGKNGVARQVFIELDFQYVQGDSVIYEDVKGFDTPESRFKRAVLEAMLGIRVSVVRT